MKKIIIYALTLIAGWGCHDRLLKLDRRKPGRL